MKHLRKLFPLYFIGVAIIPILLSNGCSSSTSATASNGESELTMRSEFAASSVSRATPIKSATPSSVDFDSIVVTNAIVFVSDLKLHSDADDTNIDTHDQEIKTGPFVILFDSGKTQLVTNDTIPAGTYDRVKFEFHKPNKNADAAILAQYPQLQNGGQTYSVWISGYTMKSGVSTPFSVTSDRSENMMLPIGDWAHTDLDSIVLVSNFGTDLNIVLDPRIVFHIGGTINGAIFDPRLDQSDIDKNILAAIRILLADA